MEPTSNGTIEKEPAEKILDVAAVMGNGGTGSLTAPKEKTVPTVRTYERDLARVMKEKKGSVIGIAIAQQRDRESNIREEEGVPEKNTLFLFFSVIAVVAGLLLLGYFFINTGGKSETAGTLKINSLINAENQKEIKVDDLSQTKLIKAVTQELASSNLRLDTVLDLYFTETTSGAKQKITTEQFFSLLGSRIPPVLLRSLGDNFMFGIHVFNGNQPFIVLKTDFYENAFLGLLKWEDSMTSDLLPLFGIKFDDTSRYLIDKQFTDGTLKNIDVRKLVDKIGKTVIVYAIPNKETIVITTGEDTLSEVINRLNAPGKVGQ